MAQALQGLVDSIVAATSGLPAPETLASWNPPLNGDIDLQIARDGTWNHGGDPIHREGLVRLFASLLRREDDGDYYLVTPAEKWRVQVERHPLLVVDFDRTGSNGDSVWYALLNTGGRCHLGGEHALHTTSINDEGGPKSVGDDTAPWMDLPNGLSAQLTRAAWYRLVSDATIGGERASIVSAGVVIDLGPIS
jgi:hypothetical protein